jgi:crotonobetainyl-CoA:carnitine CoA-transferase CaiB-like acyl-CoA transferase
MRPLSGGALEGVRVIDLTQMLAGPYATLMLADQGADVIKVEPPEGDGTRTIGPFLPEDEARAYSGYFQSINRNKRSITLDLKSEAGKGILRRLAAAADVLVENYRAGVMERLGLGYESLRQDNPRLVYAAIRGFGDARTGQSPYMNWPAYDVVAQAMGGIMGITGPAPDQPLKIGPGIGDIFPATYAAFAILAALRHAERSGEGQFLDIGMADAMLALCERIVYQYSYTGRVPHPEGNAHPLLCPFGLFPCQDGWVTIACATEGFWRLLVEAMGTPDWTQAPGCATNAERMTRRDEINGRVAEWTRAHSKAEIKARLGGRVPFGPVNTVADILADPHFAVRHMIAEVELPGIERRVQIVDSPVHMTATPGGVRRRAPRLGEDSEDVLRAIGLSEAEIAAHRAAGALG